VTPGVQTQVAEVGHKFAKGGAITVEATVHTDDLATPEITNVKTLFNVSEPPLITKQPENKSVTAGETASFEASASSAEAPTVQWELSTSKGVTWTKIIGATSTKYDVLATKTSQSGYKYRATFTNKAGEAKTNPATLTVNPKPGAPVVTRNPTSQTVTEGQSATFEAAATGSPTPAVQWEVSPNHGVTWIKIPGATGTTLVVPSTTMAQNEYQYRAFFENVNGEAESAPATLTVNEPEIVHPPIFNPGPGPEQGVKGSKTVNPPPPPPPAPAASLAGTSLTVSPSGAVVLKVSCPAGVSACLGTVTLRTLSAVSARASTAAKKAVLTLASGSFAVTGGQVKAITLRLSAKARKLLARSHTLRARATVAAHDLSGASHTAQSLVTLKPAKGKKRH
jgi:hypothetical protein